MIEFYRPSPIPDPPVQRTACHYLLAVLVLIAMLVTFVVLAVAQVAPRWRVATRGAGHA